MRGTLSESYSVGNEIRFIPARAGNTIELVGVMVEATVHPRACGEHDRRVRARERRYGSSPRVRGTLARPHRHNRLARFIPARAGNTPASHFAWRERTVHPRACGEHSNRGSVVEIDAGSSPRVRGTRLDINSNWTPPPVHPRACGEHAMIAGGVVAFYGSSPRVRGTRRRSAWPWSNRRFIPARAGNTLLRSC